VQVMNLLLAVQRVRCSMMLLRQQCKIIYLKFQIQKSNNTLNGCFVVGFSN
jgi:hypothetical protein